MNASEKQVAIMVVRGQTKSTKIARQGEKDVRRVDQGNVGVNKRALLQK
jgi:hypothetical protein